MRTITDQISSNVHRARRVVRRELRRSTLLREQVVRRFHELYYEAGSDGQTWHATHWMGVPILKCPLDMWLYQEILHKTRPDVIVETGTCHGGSALYMAQLCDLIGHGRIVTVDIEAKPSRPVHPRITYVLGSSTADASLAEVRRRIAGASKVMVVLDSDHSMRHVLDELRAYAPLVTPGCYLVVEDGNVNGHPVVPEFGPGPTEAMQAVLAETDAFRHDEAQDKFFMTFNPKGYLLRLR